jgi:DNA-binding CsgD family transcriptional regulator
VGCGREDDSRRVITWLEECAERLPCRWPRIAAATGRARLAEARGEDAFADDLFQTALKLHDEIDLPAERLQKLLEYGKFLRRSGQLARARPVLAHALEMGEAGGAVWLAGQARDELLVAGGRRRRRHEDPGRLTAQEQRVAELAASGATNPEIARQLYLSVSTIETHLGRIYAKLGIRSRRELMAMRPFAGSRSTPASKD